MSDKTHYWPSREQRETAIAKFWQDNPELAVWRDQLLTDLKTGKIDKIPTEFVAKALGAERVSRAYTFRKLGV